MRHTNSRRDLLKSIGVGAALAAIDSRGAAESPEKPAARTARPNVLFIIVDDMGPIDPGCYGGNKRKLPTPNIDRMAGEGMRFTEAYSGCCVCAPARSVLMTGKHMGHTTVRGNLGGISLLAEDVTVAQVLKKGRCAVGGFGKWGIAEVGAPGVPEKHGFDEFFRYYHQVHAHNYWTDYLWCISRNVELKGPKGSKERYAHHVIFERAKKFIRNSFEHLSAPSIPAYRFQSNKPACVQGNRSKATAHRSSTRRSKGEVRRLADSPARNRMAFFDVQVAYTSSAGDDHDRAHGVLHHVFADAAGQ